MGKKKPVSNPQQSLQPLDDRAISTLTDKSLSKKTSKPKNKNKKKKIKVPSLNNSALSNALMDNLDLIQNTEKGPEISPSSAITQYTHNQASKKSSPDSPILQKEQSPPPKQIQQDEKSSKKKITLPQLTAKQEKLQLAQIRKAKLRASTIAEINALKQNEKLYATNAFSKSHSKRYPPTIHDPKPAKISFLRIPWAQPAKLFGNLFFSGSSTFHKIWCRGDENSDSVYSVPWISSDQRFTLNKEPLEKSRSPSSLFETSVVSTTEPNKPSETQHEPQVQTSKVSSPRSQTGNSVSLGSANIEARSQSPSPSPSPVIESPESSQILSPTQNPQILNPEPRQYKYSQPIIDTHVDEASKYEDSTLENPIIKAVQPDPIYTTDFTELPTAVELQGQIVEPTEPEAIEELFAEQLENLEQSKKFDNIKHHGPYNHDFVSELQDRELVSAKHISGQITTFEAEESQEDQYQLQEEDQYQSQEEEYGHELGVRKDIGVDSDSETIQIDVSDEEDEYINPIREDHCHQNHNQSDEFPVTTEVSNAATTNEPDFDLNYSTTPDNMVPELIEKNDNIDQFQELLESTEDPNQEIAKNQHNYQDSLSRLDDRGFSFGGLHPSFSKSNSASVVPSSFEDSNTTQSSLKNVPLAIVSKSKSEFEVHLSPRSKLSSFNIWPTKDMYEVSQAGVLTSIFKRPSDKLAELQNQSDKFDSAQKKLKVDDYNSFSTCLTALSKKKRPTDKATSSASRRARLLSSRPYFGIGYGSDTNLFENMKLPIQSTGPTTNQKTKTKNSDNPTSDTKKTPKKSESTPKSTKRKSVTAKVLLNIINEVPSDSQSNNNSPSNTPTRPNTRSSARKLDTATTSGYLLQKKSKLGSVEAKEDETDQALDGSRSVYVDVNLPAKSPFKFVRKDAALKRKSSLFESIANSSIVGLGNINTGFSSGSVVPATTTAAAALSLPVSSNLARKNSQLPQSSMDGDSRSALLQVAGVPSLLGKKRLSLGLSQPQPQPQSLPQFQLQNPHNFANPFEHKTGIAPKRSRNTIFSLDTSSQSSESPFVNTLEIRRKSRSTNIGLPSLSSSEPANMNIPHTSTTFAKTQQHHQLFNMGMNQTEATANTNTSTQISEFTSQQPNTQNQQFVTPSLFSSAPTIGKPNIGSTLAINEIEPKKAKNQAPQVPTLTSLPSKPQPQPLKSLFPLQAPNHVGDELPIYHNAFSTSNKSIDSNEILLVRSTVLEISKSELPQFDFKLPPKANSTLNSKSLSLSKPLPSSTGNSETANQAQKLFKFEFTKIKPVTLHLATNSRYSDVYSSVKSANESELPVFTFSL